MQRQNIRDEKLRRNLRRGRARSKTYELKYLHWGGRIQHRGNFPRIVIEPSVVHKQRNIMVRPWVYYVLLAISDLEKDGWQPQWRTGTGFWRTLKTKYQAHIMLLAEQGATVVVDWFRGYVGWT